MDPRAHQWPRETIKILGGTMLLAMAHELPAGDERLTEAAIREELPADELSVEEMLSEDAFKIPLWDYSADLLGGLGYKDNVLLSHAGAEASAFWMTGIELMIFRLPTRGWQFHLFADASDLRYFSSPSVDDEQVALVATQLSKELGRDGKAALGLNYLYQNQVFDYSATYTNEISVGQILGHTLTPRATLRKGLGAFWIEGEMNGTRQWLEEPLDDYWLFGPRAVAGYRWGRGSELALVYQWSRLDYDRREQADRTGVSIAHTSLALDAHYAELSLTRVWDEKQHWRTVTALGYENTWDNGSGFYDYEDYRVAQQIRYRTPKWELTARAALTYYDYALQTVSATDSAPRRRTLVRLGLRAEHTLAKHLKAQASYSWDRSFSDLEFDDYQANVVLGGLALTF